MRGCYGLLILLAGCATAPLKAPSVLKVPVVQIVAVPAELTKPCPVAMPKANTVAEAVRVARERRASLETCNAQLNAIRSLGP